MNLQPQIINMPIAVCVCVTQAVTDEAVDGCHTKDSIQNIGVDRVHKSVQKSYYFLMEVPYNRRACLC